MQKFVQVLEFRVRPEECEGIPVGGFFSEGEQVVELYTGQRAAVTGGKVQFDKYENGVAVIVKELSNKL